MLESETRLVKKFDQILRSTKFVRPSEVPLNDDDDVVAAMIWLVCKSFEWSKQLLCIMINDCGSGWQLFCCSGSEICWHTMAAKFMRERQETLARSNEMAPLTILNRNLSVNLTRRIGSMLIRKHVFWLYLEVTVKGQLNCQVDTWKCILNLGGMD